MLSSVRSSGFGLLSKSAGLVSAASVSSLFASPLAPNFDALRTATKKAGGIVVNKSDSIGRRLGIKASGGEAVTTSNIIVRQRGTTYHPGFGVFMGRDHTIHAATKGTVVFTRAHIPGRKRVSKWRTFVHVLPEHFGKNDAPIVEWAAERQARYEMHAVKLRKNAAEMDKQRFLIEEFIPNDTRI
jgi:large subunit ribosomal protein L27